MSYKRLKNNLNILSLHDETNKSVLHLTGFTKTENELIKEIVSDAQKIIDKIENGTLKKVVRCKDCVYFQPEFVEMENKERRPYTKEEIKNGKFVSIEKGINCGSRCERFNYWEKNSYPVWFNENDFCSYGKLKELQK